MGLLSDQSMVSEATSLEQTPPGLRIYYYGLRRQADDNNTNSRNMCDWQSLASNEIESLVNSKVSSISFLIKELFKQAVDTETISHQCCAQFDKIRCKSSNSNFQFHAEADHIRGWSYVSPCRWTPIKCLIEKKRYDCECRFPSEHQLHVNSEHLELDKEYMAVVSKNSRFVNGARSDQRTSLDSGGEKHVIQVDQESDHHHSVIYPNSVSLMGDKQPLPNLSTPDSGAYAPSCFLSLIMMCLFVSAQLCIASPLIRYNNNAGLTLSEGVKSLLFAAKLFGFAGFLCCLGAYTTLPRCRRASRLMAAIGCVATSCGFLSILVTLLPEDLMLQLVGALS